jgi:outer membrane protein assembly factor BamB
VNIKSANKVWSFDTDNQINSSPVFYKGAVYFSNVDGIVFSLHAGSGRLRWKYQAEGSITGSPIIVNDILYIGASDNKVYALPV